MKKPASEPKIAKIRPITGWNMTRPNQRSGQRLSRKDTNEQRPNTVSAQEPTDIGDQYFISGAWNIRRQA